MSNYPDDVRLGDCDPRSPFYKEAKDAEDFFIDLKEREEAKVIVVAALIANPRQALEDYTETNLEMNDVYKRISDMVRKNNFIMDLLITNAMRIHEKEIQQRLESEE